MTPEKVIETINELSDYFSLYGEMQLADFGESAAGGPFLKMRLPDPMDLDVFRGRERATKNKQGTRYMVFMIELQDDEIPINQTKQERLENAAGEIKGGPISRDAGMLCNNKTFSMFLAEKWAIPMDAVNSEIAREHILNTCHIRSRKELDHNKDAANRYRSFIKAPFSLWCAENGL